MIKDKHIIELMQQVEDLDKSTESLSFPQVHHDSSKKSCEKCMNKDQ